MRKEWENKVLLSFMTTSPEKVRLLFSLFFPFLLLRKLGTEKILLIFGSKFVFLVTAQLKQSRGQPKSNGFSSPAMGTNATAPPPPPPPPPPKESFARRYKFLWPILLTVNLGVGGNFFFSPPPDN